MLIQKLLQRYEINTTAEENPPSVPLYVRLIHWISPEARLFEMPEGV